MGQTYIKLPSKKRVFGQMACHPFKKVFDIRGDVDLSHILLKNVSVLCQQGLIDDSPLVFGFLEVRVREEEKHFFQLKLFFPKCGYRKFSLKKQWKKLISVVFKTQSRKSFQTV